MQTSFRSHAQAKSCKGCSREFSSDNKKMVFCSPKCSRRSRGYKRPTEKTCENCHSPFFTVLDSKRFCSRECRPSSRKSESESICNSTIGAARELLVCTDLLLRGFSVFRSISPSCSCDLIAMWQTSVVRVEVTSGHHSLSGKLYWAPHEEENYDLLAVVLADRSIVYMPALETFAVSTPRLRQDRRQAIPV